MKKRRLLGSRKPKLALGTIAASSVMLAGCGDSQPLDQDAVFNTPQQCAEAGVDPQICQAEFQRAVAENFQVAPRFDDLAACEAEFGAERCTVLPEQYANGQGQGGGQQVQGGGAGSFFVPFMTGYLMSSAIGNLTSYGAYRDYARGNSYRSTPTYSTRNGGVVAGGVSNGQRITRPVNVNTRTVSRQGFGGRSFSRGFGG